MHIVEFETQDGSKLLVEVAAAAPGELVTRGLGQEEVIERAHRTFEAALQPIRAVSQGVLSELLALPRHPDEVSVEFGLEFTAQSSAVLVGAGASANVNVQLTWRAPRKPAE